MSASGHGDGPFLAHGAHGDGQIRKRVFMDRNIGRLNRVINGTKVGKVHEVWNFLGRCYTSVCDSHAFVSFFPVDSL